MHALRHLIARAGPTTMEVKMLHGLARQIEWDVRHANDEWRGSSPPE
jgi:tRNA C32,U32 (ribose-2'-O)-methylase TrmJ